MPSVATRSKGCLWGVFSANLRAGAVGSSLGSGRPRASPIPFPKACCDRSRAPIRPGNPPPNSHRLECVCPLRDCPENRAARAVRSPVGPDSPRRSAPPPAPPRHPPGPFPEPSLSLPAPPSQALPRGHPAPLAKPEPDATGHATHSASRSISDITVTSGLPTKKSMNSE